MNRYAVKVQKSLNSPIRTIVVEASSWESAGAKAERANPIVTSVRRADCVDFCDGDCK
jgi:hypothetical protein